MQALPPNFSLLFHRQVKPIDVYIARIILEAVGATISFVALAILFHVIGLVELPRDYIKMWVAWFLLVWYAGALGLLIGALSEQREIVEKLWHPCQYLLVPLSGSFFMVEYLPPAFREIMLYNPTVNCAEMFRSGYFGPIQNWYYSVSYVVVFNMTLTLIGLIQVRYVSKNLVLTE